MDDPTPTAISGKSMRLKVGIWMAFGRAIGLPVDELFEAINIQLLVGNRARGNRRAPMTLHERFHMAKLYEILGKPLLDLIDKWVLSPAAILRDIKRHQERKAQEALNQEKGPGRPRASQEKINAVLVIYGQGLHGLKRIQGELDKIGLHLARSTIRRILDDHGLEPSDDNRHPNSTWRTFWGNHAHKIVGIDYIQIATGLFGRKIQYAFALIGIEHDTRRVHLLGVTEHPTDLWLRNRLIGVTMDDGSLAKRKHWIRDNGGKFQTLPHILKTIGKRSVRTVIRTPDMNAFAERFIRSAREECLDHFIFFDPGHLQEVLSEYITHFNTERPHQGIGNKPIGPWEVGEGDIVCDERLGGLLKSFRRAA